MTFKPFIVLTLVSFLSAQSLEFIASYNDGKSNYNDIWGYVKAGKDYVMIGKQNKYGVSIYEIQSDGTAQLVGDYEEDSGTLYWSEPRYYEKNGKEYIYIPVDNSRDSDGKSPIIILDISDLNSISKVNEFSTQSHNIFTYQNMLFSCGNKNALRDNVECWSLTDPENPSLLWTYDQHYVHDLWVSDNRLYLAELYNSSFSFYDISSTPSDGSKLPESNLIARHSYTGGFTHHLCPTEDHKYLVVSDEHNQNDHLQLWDISDPNNIKNLWKHQEGTASIVHNSFIKDDYIFSSYYDRGLVIFDILDKKNPKKVAEYDTYPAGQNHSNGSFQGAWGVYPFLQNNYIAVSDQEAGLVMFKFNPPVESNLKNNYIFSSSEPSLNKKLTIVLDFENLPSALQVKKANVTVENILVDAAENIYKFSYEATTGETSVSFIITFDDETQTIKHTF